MFTTVSAGVALATEINMGLQTRDLSNKKAIVIPPYTHIHAIINAVGANGNLGVGAQNCHQQKEGAYTGEISPVTLKEMGASYVIIGHSERRQYFNETEELLNAKIKAALAEGLTVIYCIGETLSQRESDTHFAVIEAQIKGGLEDISTEEMNNIILAYEPVWAIGTGKVASPAQAQEIHQFIRGLINAKYGNAVAKNICIQYGGSMKPENAAELLSQPDIDGGLIGGAALKAEQFLAIIDAA